MAKNNIIVKNHEIEFQERLDPLDLFGEQYAIVLSDEVMQHRVNILLAKSMGTVYDVMENEPSSKERLSAVSKSIELAKYIDSRKPEEKEVEVLEDDIDLLYNGANRGCIDDNEEVEI